MPYSYKPSAKKLSPEIDPGKQSAKSGPKGPTTLKPEKGSKKAEAEKVPEAPVRAAEPAPQNTTVVMQPATKPSGQPRVLVLLGVLLGLEMVIHPGIKQWLTGAIAGLNTGLSKASKPGGK